MEGEKFLRYACVTISCFVVKTAVAEQTVQHLYTSPISVVSGVLRRGKIYIHCSQETLTSRGLARDHDRRLFINIHEAAQEGDIAAIKTIRSYGREVGLLRGGGEHLSWLEEW